MRIHRKITAIALALSMLVPVVAISQSPALAGQWSGSTPDDGNGNSVSASGQSQDVQNPDGSVTTVTDSTTTWTDNATGKVVKVIKRHREVKKKPGNKNPVTVKAQEITNNADGTSHVVSIERDFSNPPNSQSTTNETDYDQPDGKGNVTGGKNTTYVNEGGTTKKTSNHFDPKQQKWVVDQDDNAPRHGRALGLLGAALGLGFIYMEASHNKQERKAQQPPVNQPNPYCVQYPSYCEHR